MTVSKAVLRSSSSRMLRAPESAEVRRSLTTFNKGSFGAVKWEETRLEGFVGTAGWRWDGRWRGWLDQGLAF